RYDGCCYHEVAIPLADGLKTACDDGMSCDEYVSHLQRTITRPDLTGYLQSLVAQIRSESQAGIERYFASCKPPSVDEKSDEDVMVTRKWISERARIPVPTLRGPKY